MNIKQIFLLTTIFLVFIPNIMLASTNLPTKDETQATFQLRTDGVTANFRVGETLWGDDNGYKWLAIPEELQGAKFVRNAGKHQSNILFTVLRDGYLVVLFPKSGSSKMKAIEDAGWIQITHGDIVDNCDTGGWIAYRRNCKRGETFNLSVHKYHAPIILLLK